MDGFKMIVLNIYNREHDIDLPSIDEFDEKYPDDELVKEIYFYYHDSLEEAVRIFDKCKSKSEAIGLIPAYIEEREAYKIKKTEREKIIQNGAECPVCHLKTLNSEPIQRARADEPAKMKYTCFNCGYNK